MACSYRRKWNFTCWKRKSKVKRPRKKIKEDKERLCKVCGKFPIPKGNRIMCFECLRNTNNMHAEETNINIPKNGGFYD